MRCEDGWRAVLVRYGGLLHKDCAAQYVKGHKRGHRAAASPLGCPSGWWEAPFAIGVDGWQLAAGQLAVGTGGMGSESGAGARFGCEQATGPCLRPGALLALDQGGCSAEPSCSRISSPTT